MMPVDRSVPDRTQAVIDRTQAAIDRSVPDRIQAVKSIIHSEICLYKTDLFITI